MRSRQPRRLPEGFAVVITDLGMPHVDGRRVAAAVKAVSATTARHHADGLGPATRGENDIPPHVNRVLNKPPRLAALRAALFELTAGRDKSATGEAPQRALGLSALSSDVAGNLDYARSTRTDSSPLRRGHGR